MFAVNSADELGSSASHRLVNTLLTLYSTNAHKFCLVSCDDDDGDDSDDSDDHSNDVDHSNDDDDGDDDDSDDGDHSNDDDGGDDDCGDDSHDSDNIICRIFTATITQTVSTFLTHIYVRTAGEGSIGTSSLGEQRQGIIIIIIITIICNILIIITIICNITIIIITIICNIIIIITIIYNIIIIIITIICIILTVILYQSSALNNVYTSSDHIYCDVSFMMTLIVMMISHHTYIHLISFSHSLYVCIVD